MCVCDDKRGGGKGCLRPACRGTLAPTRVRLANANAPLPVGLVTTRLEPWSPVKLDNVVQFDTN